METRTTINNEEYIRRIKRVNELNDKLGTNRTVESFNEYDNTKFDRVIDQIISFNEFD